MKRAELIVIAMMLSVTSLALGGDLSIPEGKKGFGFDPGLEAGRDFVAGQVIVGAVDKKSLGFLKQDAQIMGGRLERIMEDGSAMLLSFTSEKAALAAIRSLVRRPDVRFVERNGYMQIPPKPKTIPDDPRGLKKPLRGGRSDQTGVGTSYLAPSGVSNDPGTGFQWHHTVIRKSAALPALSATPPTVAVIDTGVDYTHPDLAGKVYKGKNSVANSFDPYDDEGHGTHVAGIIAARAGNNQYGEGVCPNCRITAVKVLGSNGSGTFFDVADGVAWTVANRNNMAFGAPKVVNMSLGGAASALVATQVDAMKNAGMVLVASAGNDNTSDPANAFPGADPDTALRVTATEQNDCRAEFSNFSPQATWKQYNIAAPGWNIPSTVPEVGYEKKSGTSMASPVVAGAAALVWGQYPFLTRDSLVTRLVNQGKWIRCGFPFWTKRLDVRRAIYGTPETADIGRLLDPFIGKAPSPNTAPVLARLFHGTSQQGADATNRGGFYEMTGLTAGVRTLWGNRSGYVTSRVRNLSIVANTVTGPYTDALPRARAAGNATITLDWKNMQPVADTTGCTSGCNGWEFDLVVKLPSGAYLDWANSGDLLTSPYAAYPRDSLNDFEPLETVVVASPAQAGVYKVIVDNWPSGTTNWSDTWAGSAASVQLYNGAASIGSFYAAPPGACTTQRFWYVGDLTKSGTSYSWSNKNSCSDTIP